MKRRIIDATIFYNELNMLNMRLRELNHVVDTFVICEALQTHAGHLKPIHFQLNHQHFKPFLPKIRNLVVDLEHPSTGTRSDVAWSRENRQRAALIEGLKKLELDENDIVLIGDVDEIPNTKTLEKWKRDGLPAAIVTCMQRMFYYNFQCEFTQLWEGTVATTWKQILMQKQNVQWFRDNKGYFLKFPNLKEDSKQLAEGGWHCSYFGDVPFIINKLKNFAHVEFSEGDYVNPVKITEKIQNCQDMFPHHLVMRRNSTENNLPNERKYCMDSSLDLSTKSILPLCLVWNSPEAQKRCLDLVSCFIYAQLTQTRNGRLFFKGLSSEEEKMFHRFSSSSSFGSSSSIKFAFLNLENDSCITSEVLPFIEIGKTIICGMHYKKLNIQKYFPGAIPVSNDGENWFYAALS